MFIQVVIDGVRRMAADSAGDLRTFKNREAAKQFMRNRLYAVEGWEIVTEETTPRRW